MATSQQAAPAVDPKVHELVGKLCQFRLPDVTTNRKWFTYDTVFSEARKIFKVQPYNPTLNKGEQRPRIDSRVNFLKRVTKAGEYTPAPWSAGVRDGHVKGLDINEKTNRVKLTVSERMPLALIDGGHRFETLEDMRKEVAGDKEKLALIDNLSVSVVIYLDPEYIRDDFQHLQEGLSVNKSQLNFMRHASGNVDPKKKPFIIIANRAAIALNRSPDSFLHEQIRFASGETAPVEYSSITAPGGSDIATSLYGGARIVWVPERFRTLIPSEELGAKFLVECQNAAYQAIWKYGEMEEQKDELDGTVTKYPRLLATGRILKPTKMKGNKAGTSLLIMIGNMLAYRLLAIEKKVEPTPKDLKRLVEAVTDVLDRDMYGGGSGTVKREMTGAFVRRYFEDVVRTGPEDEHDRKKVDAVAGIPLELCDVILTRSTFQLSKNSQEFVAGDKPAGRRRTAEEQTDPEWTDDGTPGVADESGDNDTVPGTVPDFAPPEEDEAEPEPEFSPPPGRNARPVTVNKKNRAIVGMG